MPELKEGLFRGQELSCIVEIESNYFFNGTWGLTCRANQVKMYGSCVESGPDEGRDERDRNEVSGQNVAFQKGVCAFIHEQ